MAQWMKHYEHHPQFQELIHTYANISDTVGAGIYPLASVHGKAMDAMYEIIIQCLGWL